MAYSISVKEKQTHMKFNLPLLGLVQWSCWGNGCDSPTASMG